MAESKKLKRLPPRDFSSDRHNIRTIKMAKPICPMPSNDPANPPCIREFNGGRGWWDECEKRGHNPYFTEREVVWDEESWELDAQGNEISIGKKVRKRKKEKYPNVTQVPLTTRHGSGEMVQRKRERRGFKFLEEIGYEPVCQFRNCEMPVRVKGTLYGDYCSERHARLIGLDVLMGNEHDPLYIEADPAKREVFEKQIRSVQIYA